MVTERVARRLTAILAADVAGYSRLMGVDEEGTLAQLKAHRQALVDPKITEHRGRIVKTTGDGMLVEFASVVDALRCAVEVQRGMAERNAEVPEDKRIEFRMGINLCDIISDGDDIHGEGVNVAGRLEGLAEPGGLCVSEVVRDQIRDKLPYAFEDMGGRLSFSAALLDDSGDGLVLTSINGRSETRTYAKGVKAGASDHSLSPEEQQAISYATRTAREPDFVPYDRPRRASRVRRR